MMNLELAPSWRKFLLRILVVAAAIGAASPAFSAEWTIMVYMNAKNNLEPDAIDNFYSMASVGSTQDVNIVAQLGRPTFHYTQTDGPWSGVRRFLVRQETKPIPADAVSDPGADGESTDMGSPQALAQFIDWSMRKYPASRYMLIIWNHGQGWRFQLAADRKVRSTSVSREPLDARTADLLSAAIALAGPINGYRSVSFDEDTGNILYNSDVQAVLSAKFSTRKLDVFGFDACLMSMLETAYAFRKAADVMVASEELEPGEGWQYASWLKAPVSQPSIDGRGVANAVVESYRGRYGNSNLTTLSAIDLQQVNGLADSISALSRLMTSRLSGQASVVAAARSRLTPYGAAQRLKTSIDLDYFLELYGSGTTDNEIAAAVKKARAQIANIVLANYASTRDLSLYGSRGVAIYFPASRPDFLADRDHEGYLKENVVHPVEFVQKEAWADFLAGYLK